MSNLAGVHKRATCVLIESSFQRVKVAGNPEPALCKLTFGLGYAFKMWPNKTERITGLRRVLQLAKKYVTPTARVISNFISPDVVVMAFP